MEDLFDQNAGRRTAAHGPIGADLTSSSLVASETAHSVYRSVSRVFLKTTQPQIIAGFCVGAAFGKGPVEGRGAGCVCCGPCCYMAYMAGVSASLSTADSSPIGSAEVGADMPPPILNKGIRSAPRGSRNRPAKSSTNTSVHATMKIIEDGSKQVRCRFELGCKEPPACLGGGGSLVDLQVDKLLNLPFRGEILGLAVEVLPDLHSPTDTMAQCALAACTQKELQMELEME